MTSSFTRSQWKQIAGLTLGAIGLYVGFRALPTGTNLHGLDFAPTASQLEFCDPANPQFVPVVAARSPVMLELRPQGMIAQGKLTRFVLILKTVTGKPVGPADLLVAHTRKLHLLAVDPTLRDYQHLHPEPGENPGEWTFAITPHLAGDYRIFADFTPVATGRSLYASAAFAVPGQEAGAGRVLSWRAEVPGYRFELKPSQAVIRAGVSVDFDLVVTNPEGGTVALEPVMGAYAHLVAFDESRSGFAHLHPLSAAEVSRLDFKLTLPIAGLYVIWAQIKIAGEEIFAPFWFVVET